MTSGRVTLAVFIAFGVFYLGPAAADCAGPSVEAERRGDVIAVTGTGWGDACNDTGTGTCLDPPTLGDPVEGIQVSLIRSGRTLATETVDASGEYDFSVDLEAADLGTGVYRVRAVSEDGEQRASTRLRVDPES